MGFRTLPLCSALVSVLAASHGGACMEAVAFVPSRPASRSALASSSSSSRGRILPEKSASDSSPLHLVPPINDSILTSSMLSFSVPVESIQTAFTVATFLPQTFWLFLIALPNAAITKKIMGGMEVVTLCCLVHFFIVTASISQPDGTAPMAEFNDVFNPFGNPQAAMMGMMKYPNFVSEEWSHVLTWDLFVGRWIWLDGLKRGVFTSHSVLLCNLIGPPGLLLHGLTCAVLGKGFLPPNDDKDAE